jgi:hypothetical protein
VSPSTLTDYFNGIFIPAAICKYRGLSLGAKMIHGRFCRYAGRDGAVYPALPTSGSYSSAAGAGALYSNTTGNFNAASGYEALYSGNADSHTASGYMALYANTSGEYNTATGYTRWLSTLVATST